MLIKYYQQKKIKVNNFVSGIDSQSFLYVWARELIITATEISQLNIISKNPKSTQILKLAFAIERDNNITHMIISIPFYSSCDHSCSVLIMLTFRSTSFSPSSMFSHSYLHLLIYILNCNWLGNKLLYNKL